MQVRLVAIVFALLVGIGFAACSDKDSGDSGSGDSTPDSASACSCSDPEATLTAVSGCDNFGGDEEECSGWASCEAENGHMTDSAHASGTELTCFGCTFRIDCD